METKNEEWRDIEGYEGYYQVSNFGRVRKLDRYTLKTNRGVPYLQKYKGCIMKAQRMKNGYLYLPLSKNGKYKGHYIHRLVAKAFAPGYREGLAVNHIDEDKMNNLPDNLEWVTYKENNSHGTRMERIGKKERKPVLQMTITGEVIKRFESISRASMTTGIFMTNISAVCHGKYGCKTAGGYRWKFADE